MLFYDTHFMKLGFLFCFTILLIAKPAGSAIAYSSTDVKWLSRSPYKAADCQLASGAPGGHDEAVAFTHSTQELNDLWFDRLLELDLPLSPTAFDDSYNQGDLVAPKNSLSHSLPIPPATSFDAHSSLDQGPVDGHSGRTGETRSNFPGSTGEPARSLRTPRLSQVGKLIATQEPNDLWFDRLLELDLQLSPTAFEDSHDQGGLVAPENSLSHSLPSPPATSFDAHSSLDQGPDDGHSGRTGETRSNFPGSTGEPVQSLRTPRLSQVGKLGSSSDQQQNCQNLQKNHYEKFPFSILPSSRPGRVELQLPIPKFELLSFRSSWQLQGQVPTKEFEAFTQEIERDVLRNPTLVRFRGDSRLITKIEPLPVAYIPPELAGREQGGVIQFFGGKKRAIESRVIKRKLCVLMTAMYNYHALYLGTTRLTATEKVQLQAEFFAWFKLTCRNPRNSLAPLGFSPVPPDSPLEPDSFGRSQILLISFITSCESFDTQDTAICLIATFYKTRAYEREEINSFNEAQFWQDMKSAISPYVLIGTKRKPGPEYMNPRQKFRKSVEEIVV